MKPLFQVRQSAEGEYWISDADPTQLMSILTRKGAGDDPGTDDFERSFSSLAHQYIKSKAPQLIDYAIGFQTIKRVDDPSKSKAVGVFGFKVDDLWLFVPVFFLQGDLKGHELLWVKNRDAFLPCKENWVTFLINRQPTEIGEPSEGNFQGLGGRKPSFRRLFSPQLFGNKFASWVEPILPLFAAAELAPEKSHRKSAEWTEPFDLRKEAAADPEFLLRLHDVSEAYPLIKQGLDTWYGEGMVKELAAVHRKTASDGILSADPKPNLFPQLRRFAAILGEPVRYDLKKAALDTLFDQQKPAHPLTRLKILRAAESVFDADESVKRKFAADGFVAIDHRQDSEVHKVADDRENQLLSPTQSGIYEVPTLDGEHKDMICFTAYLGAKGSSKSGLLLIDPNSKDEYARFPANEVLARPDSYAGTILDDNRGAESRLRSWLQNNKTTDISENGVYIAVDPSLGCTMPFIVNKKTDNDRFSAEFYDMQTARLEVDDPHRMPNYGDRQIDVTTEHDGRRLSAGRGWLAIPKTGWLVKLEQRTKENRWEDSKAPAIANTERVLGQIQRKYARYSVFHDGESFEVKINKKSASFDREREVVIDLMTRGGLREKAARDIAALAREHGSSTVTIKHAYDGDNYSVDIPDPWTGTEQVGPNTIDSTYRQNEAIPVQGMTHPDAAQHYSQDAWFSPDASMMQMAQQASASGQKDLFDIGVLVALANTTDTETMIDRYLGRYMSAIDGLGRTLFHIYNNYDALSDRYGSSDMPQLEDGVRNTFVALGDSTLYLKEKSVGGSNNNSFGMGGGSPDISGLSA